MLTTGYIIGLMFCWISPMFTSLGNVYFKLHNEKLNDPVNYKKYIDERANSYFNYHYGGIALVLIGTLTSLVSMGLVPLSISCIHSALPIAMGELWSGYLLPHATLTTQQWLAITGILVSVGGVVACGDHDEDGNVVEMFEANIFTLGSCIFLLIYGIIFAITGMTVYCMEAPYDDRGRVVTCSMYNIAGPIFTAALGNITQVTARMVMVAAICIISSCGHTYNRGYLVLLLILPIAAIGQLKSLAFTMGTMNINTSVPLYGCGLIILPSTSAIVILGERPSVWLGFVGSIVAIILFNVYFLHLTHQKQEQDDASTASELGGKPDTTSDLTDDESKKVELTTVQEQV